MKKLHVILSVSLALAVGAMVAGCNNKPDPASAEKSTSSTKAEAKLAPGGPYDIELEPGAEQYRVVNKDNDYYLITERFDGSGEVLHDIEIMGLNAGIEAYNDLSTGTNHYRSIGGYKIDTISVFQIPLKPNKISCKNGVIKGTNGVTNTPEEFPLNSVVCVKSDSAANVVFGVVDLESHVFMEHLASILPQIQKKK